MLSSVVAELTLPIIVKTNLKIGASKNASLPKNPRSSILTAVALDTTMTFDGHSCIQSKAYERGSIVAKLKSDVIAG